MGPIRIPRGHTPLGVTHFWGKPMGYIAGCPFHGMQEEGKMLEACLAIGE